jgi:single-stranded DNA-binding protein
MNPEITLVGRLGTEPEKIGDKGIRFRVVTSDRVKNASGDVEQGCRAGIGYS